VVYARDGDVEQATLRFGFAATRGWTPTCKHVKKPAQLPHQRRRTNTQKNAMAAVIMLAFLYSRLIPYRDCEIANASSVAAALEKHPPTSAGAPRCSTTKKRRRHFNSRGLIRGLPRRAAELDRARATRCPRRCCTPSTHSSVGSAAGASRRPSRRPLPARRARQRRVNT